MKLHCAIEVSQNGLDWTILDYEPPIPLTLLNGWLFIRPVLIYLAERGDAPVLGFPPINHSVPPCE